jgi:Protein of unknown function (DUF1275)
MLTVASTMEAILVGCATILAVVSASSGIGIGRGPAEYGLIVLLGLAMGLQNATACHLTVPDLTTIVLTLMITGIAADSRPAGGAGSKLGRRGLAVLAMFLGAVVGSLLVVGGDASISLVLAFVVLGIVAGTAAMVSRANPSWAHVA